MVIYEKEFLSNFQNVDHEVRHILEVLDEIPEFRDQNLIFKINFTLREILNNAVEHGNQFDSNKKIYSCVKYDNKKLVLVVEDEGSGFDLSQRSSEINSDYVLRERNRGLELIKKFNFDIETKGSKIILTLDLSHK